MENKKMVYGKVSEILNCDDSEVNQVFIRKYRKNPDILKPIFKTMGFGYLLELNENVDILYKILSSYFFIKSFEDNKLTIVHLIKILTIYNSTPDIFFEKMKVDEKVRDAKVAKIMTLFENIQKETEDIYEFKKWYNETSIRLLKRILEKFCDVNTLEERVELFDLNDNIELLLNFDLLYKYYILDVLELNYHKKELNKGDKNVRLNYFVRELVNIFKMGDGYKISNKIIIELVALLFDKDIDDSQLKNILENSNSHVSNTNYTLEFVKTDSEFIVNYKKTKNC